MNATIKKGGRLLILVLLLIGFMSLVQQEYSLYRAYINYFPIGAAMNPEVDLSSPERQQFFIRQYNSLTPENQMKPRQIHPKENVWNWEPADRMVQFARANHLKVRGHVLVWQQNLPVWMVMQDEHFCSKEVLFQKMKNHITAVMSRYKEDVYCWDVVNEAISDNPNEIFRAKDTLFKIAGESYVEEAFRIARAADPNAKLYYNDFRFTDPAKRKKIYDLMKRLLAKGVPLDGIGFQSHYVPDEISRPYLEETIDMFAALGLDIQITELDVSVYAFRNKNHPDANKEDDAYTPARLKQQADTYRMLFDVYRKHRSQIKGITFWGSSDMRDNFRMKRIGKMDYPFLFDEYMQPKEFVKDLLYF